MKARKIIVSAACTAFLCLGSLGLVACGPNDEEIVKQCATDQLERVKTHDAELLDKVAAGVNADALAAYGIDARSFSEAFLDGFDYRIDEVSVDGKTAKASVVLTSKSLPAVMESFDQAIDAVGEQEGSGNMSEDEIAQAVGTALTDALAATGATEHAPLELDFALDEKTWSLTPSSAAQLANAVLGR